MIIQWSNHCHNHWLVTSQLCAASTSVESPEPNTPLNIPPEYQDLLKLKIKPVVYTSLSLQLLHRTDSRDNSSSLQSIPPLTCQAACHGGVYRVGTPTGVHLTLHNNCFGKFFSL